MLHCNSALQQPLEFASEYLAGTLPFARVRDLKRCVQREGDMLWVPDGECTAHTHSTASIVLETTVLSLAIHAPLSLFATDGWCTRYLFGMNMVHPRVVWTFVAIGL